MRNYFTGYPEYRRKSSLTGTRTSDICDLTRSSFKQKPTPIYYVYLLTSILICYLKTSRVCNYVLIHVSMTRLRYELEYLRDYERN